MRGLACCLGLFIILVAVPLCAQDRPSLREQGKKLFVDQGCYGCHMIGTMGTELGPNLSKVGATYSLSALTQWLRDPASQKPTAHMPKLTLSEDDIQALAAYLSSLR